MPPLRILHLNSMLKGGGTDDRSVRIAHALLGLGHRVWMAGPAGREFSKVTEALGIPFVPVESGPLKLPLIFGVARFLRRENGGAPLTAPAATDRAAPARAHRVWSGR